MKTVDMNLTRHMWKHLNSNRDILRGYHNGHLTNGIWNLADKVLKILFELKEFEKINSIAMKINSTNQTLEFVVHSKNTKSLTVTVGYHSVVIVHHIRLHSENTIIQSWGRPIIGTNLGLQAFLDECFCQFHQTI